MLEAQAFDGSSVKREKPSQPAGKPNSVSRLRPPFGSGFGATTIIPLGPRLLAGSSDLPGGLNGPFCGTHVPPYLVLLRAGFCLPPVLPRARCALTAPFHPYPRLARFRALARGGIFSVPLSFRLPCPGVTRRTALRSSDFPLAFALRALRQAGLAVDSRFGAERAKSSRQARERARRGSSVHCGGLNRLKAGSDSVDPLSDLIIELALAIHLLRDSVLLQLLVQIAARRADHFRRLRDVPVVLAEFADEERPLGGLLELAQRAGAILSLSGRRRGFRFNAARYRAGRPRRSSRPAS